MLHNLINFPDIVLHFQSQLDEHSIIETLCSRRMHWIKKQAFCLIFLENSKKFVDSTQKSLLKTSCEAHCEMFQY